MSAYQEMNSKKLLIHIAKQGDERAKQHEELAREIRAVKIKFEAHEHGKDGMHAIVSKRLREIEATKKLAMGFILGMLVVGDEALKAIFSVFK